ncbi:hypothetical protein F5J12DRAFT_784860 [Pisolithus orientalis]|uniref:uncharacterized protein n=1 Tax=Pisolithus orientalis TaxID=936130 RepID=UPI002224E895|nr:uncharacterized protein F5J12DRAFT_784860 [Pisolithus orientalis]KAI5998522.1 hypothetical protein F5J12DRAFT_784860 [Pisolithus orientalis]
MAVKRYWTREGFIYIPELKMNRQNWKEYCAKILKVTQIQNVEQVLVGTKPKPRPGSNELEEWLKCSRTADSILMWNMPDSIFSCIKHYETAHEMFNYLATTYGNPNPTSIPVKCVSVPAGQSSTGKDEPKGTNDKTLVPHAKPDELSSEPPKEVMLEGNSCDEVRSSDEVKAEATVKVVQQVMSQGGEVEPKTSKSTKDVLCQCASPVKFKRAKSVEVKGETSGMVSENEATKRGLGEEATDKTNGQDITAKEMASQDCQGKSTTKQWSIQPPPNSEVELEGERDSSCASSTMDQPNGGTGVPQHYVDDPSGNTKDTGGSTDVLQHHIDDPGHCAHERRACTSAQDLPISLQTPAKHPREGVDTTAAKQCAAEETSCKESDGHQLSRDEYHLKGSVVVMQAAMQMAKTPVERIFKITQTMSRVSSRTVKNGKDTPKVGAQPVKAENDQDSSSSCNTGSYGVEDMSPPMAVSQYTYGDTLNRPELHSSAPGGTGLCAKQGCTLAITNETCRCQYTPEEHPKEGIGTMAVEQHAVGSSEVQEVKMLQNECNCAPAIPQESYQGWHTLKSLPDDKAREPEVHGGTETSQSVSGDVKWSAMRPETGPTSAKTAKTWAYLLHVKSQPKEAIDEGNLDNESSRDSTTSNNAIDTLGVKTRMLAGSSIQYCNGDWSQRPPVPKHQCGCIKFKVPGQASTFEGIKRLFEVLGTIMPIVASIESKTLNKGQGINTDASKWYLESIYSKGPHEDSSGDGTCNQWNRCKKTKHDSAERRLAKTLQRPLQGLTQASGYHCHGCAFQRFSESKPRRGEDEEGPGTAIRHGGDTIGGLWVLEIGLEVEGVIGEGGIDEVGLETGTMSAPKILSQSLKRSGGRGKQTGSGAT